MRQFIFIIILLLTSISVSSQYYSSGADPADVQWRQIKSKVFRVVYPEEFEGEAKRFIAMLDSLYEYGAYALDHTPKPIDVLIHSRSAYSNGFVSWAPKRMEIYPTPHQDMFAQDWLQQLAIHEFRHVVQIDKLNQGFTKLLTYPFGQQAIGAVLGLYAPLWFLEGDAVLTETTLSESGRGRRPSFEQEIRAQVLEKEIYNYDKAYFGSYKDYVPNHYNMGYLMVAGARHKYGADIWEKALDEAAKKPWSVTPFNRGIKKVSGKNKVPLYNEVFNDWKSRWQNQSDSLPSASIKYITKRDNHYKNYRYPTPINDSLLIAEVNGPGELNHFALINTRSGKEKKLLVTGSRSREPFSYSNETLVWTELEQHPRWENQVFSVIRSYNLTSAKQKKVTFTSRYKAPALSPDGNTIAVSHTSYSNEHSIHLLDAVTGEVLKEIATPNNAYPFTPSWNTEGDELVMILLDNNGKRISFLNTTSSQWSDLTTAGFTEVRFPKYHRNHIYFTGSYSGIENIYRISKTGGELEKISESKFGATYASFSNNQMYFQDYTSDGYLIAAANYNELDATPYKMEQLPIEPYINKLQKEEKGLPQLTNLPTEQYTSKKYSKWNLFNFHSWAPAYVNINDPEIKTGISVMSQNLLGTTVTSIGFNADQQYSREKFNFNIAYRAWWPVLKLDFKAGNEKVNGTYINENETYIFRYDAKPNHYQLDFDLELPINLSRGKYSRYIQPSIGLSYQSSDDFDYTRYYLELDENGQPIRDEDGKYQIDYTEIHTNEGINIQSVDYKLFAYNLHRSSLRDVASRFGQVIDLSYRHTPFNGWDYGSIFGIHTRLYFPGIGRHHAIRIDNDWQKKKKGEITDYRMGDYVYYRSYSDYIRFPRGVNKYYNDELYSFKADYMMPLINPDLNIPGLMYLKRITTNLFFDYSHVTQKLQEAETGNWVNNQFEVKSLGAEIRGELHPFRFVFPITTGYRYAYLPDSKEHYHEFLLSMGLAGIIVGK